MVIWAAEQERGPPPALPGWSPRRGNQPARNTHHHHDLEAHAAVCGLPAGACGRQIFWVRDAGGLGQQGLWAEIRTTLALCRARALLLPSTCPSSPSPHQQPCPHTPCCTHRGPAAVHHPLQAPARAGAARMPVTRVAAQVGCGKNMHRRARRAPQQLQPACSHGDWPQQQAPAAARIGVCVLCVACVCQASGTDQQGRFALGWPHQAT